MELQTNIIGLTDTRDKDDKTILKDYFGIFNMTIFLVIVIVYVPGSFPLSKLQASDQVETK